MKRFIILAGLILLVFLVLIWIHGTSLSLAEIPKLINYQGMLTESDGTNPVQDGDYNLGFKIYGSESGDDSLWWEYHSNVPVEHGLFNVILGSESPLNLPFDATYWLEIRVGGEVMPTRLRFTSVGYAYRAAEADTADFARIFTGQVSNADMVDSIHASKTPEPSKLLALDGSAKFPSSAIPAVSNADMVDSMHASKTPEPNKLLALDGSAKFPSSVITAVSNADMVDSIHACKTPEANKLLALDGSAKFPSSVITAVSNADMVDSIHASTSPTPGYLYPLDSNSKIPNAQLYTGSGNGLNADMVDGKHNGELTADIWDGHHWGDKYPSADYADNADKWDNHQWGDNYPSADYAENSHKWNGHYWGDPYPNTDSLNGISASSTPLPNNLYPLDDQGRLAFHYSSKDGSPAIPVAPIIVAIAGVAIPYGIQAVNTSITGVGHHGKGDLAGVKGESTSNTGMGVWGISSDGIGVSGSGEPGVKGVSNSMTGIGVVGESGSGSGVGVFGSGLTGVQGQSSSGKGVWGYSNSGEGVRGESDYNNGVYGYSEASAWNGVLGENANGNGVYGYSAAAGKAGVFGYNTGGEGVHGQTNNASAPGVAAVSKDGSPSNPGLMVYGYSQATGAKYTVVQTSQGQQTLAAIESPDVEFYASGTAKLFNGEAQVVFERLFSEAISSHVPLKIVVTPKGAWSGLYVAEQSAEGFLVKTGAGATDCEFDWIAIGRRKGYEERPLISMPPKPELEPLDLPGPIQE